MFIISSLLCLFLLIPSLGVASPTLEFMAAYSSIEAEKENVSSECLVNSMVPPWTTINPKDESKTLYQGEVVSYELLTGKPGDGSCATCMYQMRLKSDHSITWTCFGLANSERLARQGAK